MQGQEHCWQKNGWQKNGGGERECGEVADDAAAASSFFKAGILDSNVTKQKDAGAGALLAEKWVAEKLGWGAGVWRGSGHCSGGIELFQGWHFGLKRYKAERCRGRSIVGRKMGGRKMGVGSGGAAR
jgi:hypothetical protein